MGSDEGRALTVRQLAHRWGCSHSHVQTLILRGRLQALNIAEDPTRRSRWAIPLDVVEAFEQSRTADALMPLNEDLRRSPSGP